MARSPSRGAPADRSASPCTCFRARKLARLLTQRYDQGLAGSGLTVNQYSILRHVARGEASITTLARRLGMDRSTLSRELGPLQAAGWLARGDGSDGGDGRQRMVALTAAGADRIRQAKPAWQRAQRALATTVGADALQQLHDAIDATLARLQAPAP